MRGRLGSKIRRQPLPLAVITAITRDVLEYEGAANVPRASFLKLDALTYEQLQNTTKISAAGFDVLEYELTGSVARVTAICLEALTYLRISE